MSQANLLMILAIIQHTIADEAVQVTGSHLGRKATIYLDYDYKKYLSSHTWKEARSLWLTPKAQDPPVSHLIYFNAFRIINMSEGVGESRKMIRRERTRLITWQVPSSNCCPLPEMDTFGRPRRSRRLAIFPRGMSMLGSRSTGLWDPSRWADRT